MFSPGKRDYVIFRLSLPWELNKIKFLFKLDYLLIQLN